MSEVINVIGDVKGRQLILIDDIVDTAGTLCNAATALMTRGAASVHAYVTHGVLSDPALEKINAAPLDYFVVTDSIRMRDDIQRCDKIQILYIAPLLADAIKRIYEEKSISVLFE